MIVISGLFPSWRGIDPLEKPLLLFLTRGAWDLASEGGGDRASEGAGGGMRASGGAGGRASAATGGLDGLPGGPGFEGEATFSLDSMLGVSDSNSSMESHFMDGVNNSWLEIFSSFVLGLGGSGAGNPSNSVRGT